jgi:hypothetical protein
MWHSGIDGSYIVKSYRGLRRLLDDEDPVAFFHVLVGNNLHNCSLAKVQLNSFS